MSVIAFSPKIGPVRLSVVVSEDHSSSIEITGNPIETGAEVNDHAYIKPKEVTLDIADRFAAQTYNAIINFQESRVPFVLVTGLRFYRNMLVQAIDAYRDKDTSRILRATIYLREVIIVDTATMAGNSSGERGRPGGKNSRRSASPSSSSANNSTTANRAAGTVSRGDTPSRSVPPARSQSLAKSIFG